MIKEKLKKSYIIFRIILWIILFCFIGYFLYKGIVPSGKAVYFYDFEKNSRIFSDLRPAERVEKTNDGTERIVGDPVYFSLYTPRRFDEAKMTIKYKTNEAPPVIEAGVMVDKESWRYVLKPICNKIFNQLALVWKGVGDQDVTLLQKTKKYESLNEFFDNLPPLEKIATYNYDLKADYIMEGYEVLEDQEKNALPVSFLGNWQALLYLKNENLDVDFAFYNLDSAGVGEAAIRLFYDKTLIATEQVVCEKNGKVAELNFSALNLPEGVYRLEFQGNNIVTKAMELGQEKIVFSAGVNLFSAGKNSFTIFTDSKNVQLTTVNPNDLQSVYMNDKEYKIDETYKQFEIKTEPASSTVPYASLDFERGGFSIAGDGVFTFLPDSFFNPRLKKLDRNIDVMGDGVEYVIAKYNPPLEDNSWMISSAEFDMSQAFREEGIYEFMISIPGLRTDDVLDDYIEIDEIKLELRGKSLLSRVKDFFVR